MIFLSLKHRAAAAFVRRRDDRLGMAARPHRAARIGGRAQFTGPMPQPGRVLRGIGASDARTEPGIASAATEMGDSMHSPGARDDGHVL